MPVILVSLAHIALIVVWTKRDASRQGLMSAAFLVGLGTWIYYSSIPVELALRGERWVRAPWGYVEASPGECLAMSVLGLVAYVAFMAGFQFSGGAATSVRIRRALLTSSPTSLAGRQALVAAVAPLAVAALGIAFFYPTELLEVGGYVASSVLIYESSAFAYLAKTAYVFSAVGGILLLRSELPLRKWTGWALLAAAAGWGAYTGSKDPIVVGVLAVGYVWLRDVRASTPRAAAMLLAAILAILGFSGFFGAWRAGAGFDAGAIARGTSFLTTDPAGPTIVFLVLMKSDVEPIFGKSYLAATTEWIPRFVWRDRPLTLSERFARASLSNWSSGQGLGFSLAAEGYANFRYLGPLIAYALLGAAWPLFWRTFANLTDQNPALVGAIYATVGNYLLFSMHRGPVGFVINSLIHVMVPTLLSYHVVQVVMSRRRLPRGS